MAKMENNLIPSFSVDHTKIIPGIYVSRVDSIGSEFITTFDIRLKRPNREPVMDVMAMHSLEHIIATYLRNNPIWKDKIIYWGPMGCLTGFYLIVKGKFSYDEGLDTIYFLMFEAFLSVGCCESVPGTNPENCGYYKMHNLDMAKYYAREFTQYLKNNISNPDIYNYPKTERLVVNEGNNFYDS